MTEQRRTPGAPEETAGEQEGEKRLPPEVQGESEMGQEPTVVPDAGAPSIPMEQPEEREGSTG
nr:hypothetical protein [Pseudonocardia nigra]